MTTPTAVSVAAAAAAAAAVGVCLLLRLRGDRCVVKVGRLAPIAAEVRWVREVDESLWHTVCEDPRSAGGGRVRVDPAGLMRRAEVSERLLREHMAEETDVGFRFADEGIRVSLLRRAEQEGRLSAHHEACGEALSRLPTPDPARIGRHLRGAGHLDLAFRQLMTAAWSGLDATHDIFVQNEEGEDVDVGHHIWAEGPCTACSDNAVRPMSMTASYSCGRMMFSTYHTTESWDGHTKLTPQELVLLYIILEIGVCFDEPPPPPPPID